MPLIADENTYNTIGSHILEGKYYYKNYPSTVTPIIPFILAFLKTSTTPLIGLTLHKLIHLLFAILGFRYLYLFLTQLRLKTKLVLAIIAITAVNPIGITFFARLYPEGILMFTFWGFIYYSTTSVKKKHFIKMLLFFVMLILTRYVYAILGLIILYNCFRYYKASSYATIYSLLKYSILISLPVLLWLKYVQNIEKNNLSEISYFSRFEAENPLLYNIKAGLGIIKHEEVNKINGIPAFASLFIPIDGYRNYLLSIGFIILFLAGYLTKPLKFGEQILLSAIILTMLGLIIAGTGFSRYWLILLAGFVLGIYYFLERLSIRESWILNAMYVISIIYIINEFRLDYLILNRYI
ncbi:hypothetical protein [Winogradskyella poriferorum]|uniref:hypothetical protein n=1 Tax=Winogradskyella poriferorum TaxID=307627 RepID=UPI003D65229A